jgi:hypothetical protein
MLIETNVGGALAPSLLLYVLVSIVLFLVTDRVASAIGFYRIVWHPALVRFAVWVCLLSALVLLTRPAVVTP